MTTCLRPNCDRPRHRRNLCHAHYRALLRQRPSGMVPVGPVIAHIAALRAAGYTVEGIAAVGAVSRSSTLRGITAPGRIKMRRVTAERILAVPIPSSPMETGARLIPVLGSARRVQALIADGHRAMDLQELLGLSACGVGKLINGHQELISATLARRIKDMFDDLQLRPAGNVRSVRRGRREQWSPPLAWDEDTIDDPDAVAHECSRTPLTRGQRIEEARDMLTFGLTDAQAAARLGISAGSVADYRNNRVRNKKSGESFDEATHSHHQHRQVGQSNGRQVVHPHRQAVAHLR